jgi:hypothetical protein
MHPKAVLARDWLLTLGPIGAWSKNGLRANRHVEQKVSYWIKFMATNPLRRVKMAGRSNRPVLAASIFARRP